jgi:hypothetical protein
MRQTTGDISIDQLANLARNGGMARKKGQFTAEVAEEVRVVKSTLSPLKLKISHLINSLKI